MKIKIIYWLRRLASWLEGDSNAEFALVKQLVQAADLLIDVSGEYKRHIVYAQLLKEFPTQSKRYLALQIEKALNV